jgi:hypothetical protein
VVEDLSDTAEFASFKRKEIAFCDKCDRKLI